MSTTTIPSPKDFTDLVNILAELSDANNQLKQLQTDMDREHLATVHGYREQYAALQKRVSDAEAALEVIAARNPQWFADEKTVETPYGDVKRTTSKKLEIPSEEASIARIKAAGKDELLRVEVTINKEAAELLSDEELAKFGIHRKKTENYNAKPATIDLGKAIKAADKSAAAAAKTARAAGKVAR